MRPAFINALFMAASFLAPACAIFDYQWETTAPPMVPVWLNVTPAMLAAMCPANSVACVHRDYKTLTCYVYTIGRPEELPRFVVEHEEIEHCLKGKSHHD